MSFEPKILGFLCNWCSYAGADLAGVSRMQYPSNLRVIRVMCSGRVDPEFIFEGFKTGLDGIIVMGCHPGDCHYLEGNYEAMMKFDMTKKFLKYVNLDDRVRLEWVSASEGNRFAEVITDFTENIRKLGPSPINGEDCEEILENLEAIHLAATGYRMRALVGRERALIEQGNVYEELIPKEKFDTLFNKAIYDEYLRSRMLISLRKDSKSVKDLAIELNIPANEVLDHILVLKGRGNISMSKIVGITPLYMVMEG
ncbi:MAG: hydrogenase iron-sulfur subunit [Candidatus Lokiarchaeota archaeon]